MGGSRTTTTTQNTNQNSQSSLGSTNTANSFLPGFQTAGQNALNMGQYAGDVAAPQEVLDQYSPILDPNGSVTQLIADPGAPLDRYMPDVNIMDRYVAGLGEASQSGIAGGLDWINQSLPWMQQGAQDMGQFWGDVARGVYLDPNQNTAYQGWLDTFDESMRDSQGRQINQFNDAATMAGAYGDTNFARGRTWMADEFDQNRSATVAGMNMSLYEMEMARRERASQGLEGAFALGGMPFASMDMIGERQRQGAQYDINDQGTRNSEIERQQEYAIREAEARRRDEFLRAQAGLDNTAAMAQWDYNRQQGQVADAVSRAQVNQQNRQGELLNDQNRHWAEGLGALDIYNQIFQTLANPVFGEFSSGSSNSTSRTRESVPAWQQIMGGLSALGSTAGALGFGGGAGSMFSGLGSMFGGGMSGGGAGGGTGVPMSAMPQIQLPQIDWTRYMSSSSGSGSSQPWWLQGGGG